MASEIPSNQGKLFEIFKFPDRPSNPVYTQSFKVSIGQRVQESILPFVISRGDVPEYFKSSLVYVQKNGISSRFVTISDARFNLDGLYDYIAGGPSNVTFLVWYTNGIYQVFIHSAANGLIGRIAASIDDIETQF